MENDNNYTMLSDSTSIESKIKYIKDIDKKIIEIHKSIIKNKWDQTKDTRMLLLVYLNELNTNTILGYCFQAENLKLSSSKDWWLEKFDHMEDVINRVKDFDLFATYRNDSYFNMLKDSYLFNFYFEFETRIRHIVREIGNINNPNIKTNKNRPFLDGNEGFYFISKGFFEDYLSLTVKEYEVIHIYSEIRNTLHNSGFYFPHDGKDKTLRFKGEDYVFKNKAPVNFLDNNLYQALINALVDLISITLKHNKIKDIKEILDPVSNIKWVY